MLLDKDTVRTRRLRGGGLEIADALGPTDQFICVKKADSTAPLNHLFAQGRVAIETPMRTCRGLACCEPGPVCTAREPSVSPRA